jgi:hypothetical protein
MNARRTPKYVLNAHPPASCWFSQLLALEISQSGRPAANLCQSAGADPHNRLGPVDPHGLEDRRKPTIQLDEEQAIGVCELDATAQPALQHNQLMPERGILRFNCNPFRA